MVTFATANANGTLTERLGIGLQNRVRRFESARYLQKKIGPKGSIFFLGDTWTFLFVKKGHKKNRPLCAPFFVPLQSI